MSFFSTLFKKEDSQPTREPPKFYQRPVDERRDLTDRLDKKVANCEKRINAFNTEIQLIDQQIKEKKTTYDRYKNKQSPQATALRTECVRLMAEKEKLVNQRTNYEQQKMTAAMNRDNLTSIVDVEELHELTGKATSHIQQAMGKIDLHTAKNTASDARTANKSVQQITAYIINPHDIDLAENDTAFSAAFDQLEFGEDEFLSDEQNEEILAPVTKKQPATQVITNKPKQAVLDDDLF